MIIKKNTILILTNGRYSDFTFSGPFKVLKDIDQIETSNLFRQQWKPKRVWDDKPREEEFIAWLSTNDFIEDILFHEWHIGEFFSFNPVIQEEPSK